MTDLLFNPLSNEKSTVYDEPNFWAALEVAQDIFKGIDKLNLGLNLKYAICLELTRSEKDLARIKLILSHEKQLYEMNGDKLFRVNREGELTNYVIYVITQGTRNEIFSEAKGDGDSSIKTEETK